MKLLDCILGPKLASSDQEENRIGVLEGVPMLGLDALSSAAYGPEAALTVLLPLGAAGLMYVGPIMWITLALLLVLYFSYMQTIAAYPQGGGSYTVAKDNLGTQAGLLAAASLLLDYVLNVAVGISAGVGALVSAVPPLHPHILALCLIVLILITVVNLRGIRESGRIFAVPTYLFVGSLAVVLGTGIYRTLAAAGHPTPIEAPPPFTPATAGVAWWLLLRSFASGCTAMTGVEAVSNGVSAFRKPAVVGAQRTLTVIIAILATLLFSIAFLARSYHVGATPPDTPQYQTVISQLVAAIMGRGWFYYVTQASVLSVLCLSANTSFADFPRLCRLIAEDRYLPYFFSIRGRRLVFTMGILILAALSAILLIAFGGITDRLIPLFAIGAFGAFTLSQCGMVVHWRKQAGSHHARFSLMVNGIGAICTAVALAVILIAKFAEGAWVTVLLIPCLISLFKRTHGHYERARREMRSSRPLDVRQLADPVVVVPLRGWTRVSEKALLLALELSRDVVAVTVEVHPDDTRQLRELWPRLVEEPARQAGLECPQLRVVPSPYRDLVEPLLEVIRELQESHPHRLIMVTIPELVEAHWYTYFLHSQTALLLKAALLFLGDPRVVVLDVPWYLHERDNPNGKPA